MLFDRVSRCRCVWVGGAVVVWLTAALGAGFECLAGEPPLSEKAAIAALIELGGVVLQTDDRLPGRPVTTIDFSNNQEFEESWLKYLAAFPQLTYLGLSNVPITEAGLAQVKNCSQLETLTLARTKISDAGLDELRGLKRLRRLDLRRTGITDLAAAKLSQSLPQTEIMLGPLPDKVMANPLAAPTARPATDKATSFSAARINRIRQLADEATQVPENTAEGWSKSRVDPMRLVDIFRPLRLRTGIVLRGYQFKEEGNGNGVVWAMPVEAEFPEPKDTPILEQHLLKAPKPSEALDDAMEAIEGDGSASSYLAASFLRRQLSAFGAMWHGARWSTHVVLDGDPLQGAAAKEGDSPLDRPTSDPRAWKWAESAPKTWAPVVNIGNDSVTVTFYTYSALYKEGIYRHIDTYRPGKYRAKVEEKKIAEGPGGVAF